MNQDHREPGTYHQTLADVEFGIDTSRKLVDGLHTRMARERADTQARIARWWRIAGVAIMIVSAVAVSWLVGAVFSFFQ